MSETFTSTMRPGGEALLGRPTVPPGPGRPFSPNPGNGAPRPRGMFVFDAVGEYPLSGIDVPPGQDIRVECIGAGGPGGFVPPGTTQDGGAGGGAGGWCRVTIGAGLWAVGGSIIVGPFGEEFEPTGVKVDGVYRVTAHNAGGAEAQIPGSGGTCEATSQVRDFVTEPGAEGELPNGQNGGQGGTAKPPKGGVGGVGGTLATPNGQNGAPAGGGGGGCRSPGGLNGTGARGLVRIWWPANAEP